MKAEHTLVISTYPSPRPLPTNTRFHLHLHEDRVLVLQWDNLVTATLDDAVELIRHADLLAPDARSPMLVELNGMVTMSRPAFVLLAVALDVSAVAFVGTCPEEKVIIAHFETVHRPPYPVRYFNGPEQALVWLGKQRAVLMDT